MRSFRTFEWLRYIRVSTISRVRYIEIQLYQGLKLALSLDIIPDTDKCPNVASQSRIDCRYWNLLQLQFPLAANIDPAVTSDKADILLLLFVTICPYRACFNFLNIRNFR